MADEQGESVGFKVCILGWAKINARKDVENPSWFKFKHKFFSDTEFYDFSDSEKVCWLYMLCEASKKNDDGNFVLNVTHAQNVANISAETIRSTLKKLEHLRIVTFSASRRRHVGVTSAGVRQEKSREEKIREEERRGEESASDTPPALGPFADDERLTEVFADREVSVAAQWAWVEAFPEKEWIREQVFRALAWEEANPHKRKKHFARFISNWLARGWDDHRSKQPSRKPGGFSVTEHNADSLAEYKNALRKHTA